MAGVEERHRLLLEDPDLSRVEAHRVFCQRCDKWLKLDETKLYAASVWRCHKNTKSHNAKVPNLSASAPRSTGDADIVISGNKIPSTSGSLVSTPRDRRECNSAGPSRRALTAEGTSRGREIGASLSQPSKISGRPPLMIKVPARRDSVSVSAPLSSGTPAAQCTPSTSTTGTSKKTLVLPIKKSRPSRVAAQDSVNAQLGSRKSENLKRSMLPPSSPPSMRKSAGQHTAQACTSNSIALSPGKDLVTNSQSSSHTHPISGGDVHSSSAGSSASCLPPLLQLPPERQASYEALLAEPLIDKLEPYRAFCSLCQCWVDLSLRTPYSHGVWKGHIRKSENHIRLQTDQAENECEMEIDHFHDESGALAVANKADVTGSVDKTDEILETSAPSNPVSGVSIDIQGRASDHPKRREDDTPLLRLEEMISVWSNPFPSVEVPFPLKATTEDSFGPRQSAEDCESMESDIDLLDISESTDEEPPKLTPVAAMQKRRDSMLGDPDAAVVEPRRVQCRICERWIKGSNTQEYSSHHWLKHKKTCAQSQTRENERWSETAETRKQCLEADPDVQTLEPHRALCKQCSKWVKLCSRSRFSASHWLQHKKKCPAMGDVGSSAAPTECSDGPAPTHSMPDETQSTSKQRSDDASEEHRAALLSDPHVMELHPDRVRCKECSQWIKLSTSVEYESDNWLYHKYCCHGAAMIPFRDAQSRKKVLENDSDVKALDPHRALCRMCDVWIELHPEFSYSLAKWVHHRKQCGQATRDFLRIHGHHHHPAESDSDATAQRVLTRVLKRLYEPENEDNRRLDHENEDGEVVDNGPKDVDSDRRTSDVVRDADTGPSGSPHGLSHVVDADGDVEMSGAQSHRNATDSAHRGEDDKGKNNVKDSQGEKSGGSAQRRTDTKLANISEKRSMIRDNLGHQAVEGRRPRIRSGRWGRGRSMFPEPIVKKKAAPFMRAQSAVTLPPLPCRPRWLDENERKQQFASDPDVLRVEPHRLLCKHCRCWIRLHPIIRYSQSVWPRHKESCKETFVLECVSCHDPFRSPCSRTPCSPGDAKTRAKTEKEDARQRLLEDDPYATDVGAHRVTCKACGTNIRLDTTYKYEGSHWRAHRSRCTRIPFHERLAKKRKAPEPVQETIAIVDSSDSDDSDTSSVPRPRPTSFFTAPLVVRPMEMFKRRPRAPAPSEVGAVKAKSQKEAQKEAQRKAELTAGLEDMAAQLITQGRFSAILQRFGDGQTTMTTPPRPTMDENFDADGSDIANNAAESKPLPQSPKTDPESLVPRKRTREEDEAFDKFFATMPLPRTPPPHPKTKVRICKLDKDAMSAVD